jgi:hypothetical protein
VRNGREALKERNNSPSVFRTFSALFKLLLVTRGDALASLALAPGYHIPRLWRLVSTLKEAIQQNR